METDENRRDEWKLLQEDQNMKRKRELVQKQSSILSKLVRQLSVHDNRAAAASSWSDNGGAVESSTRMEGSSGGDDWRTAFHAAANGSADLSRTHSRWYSDPLQNGNLNASSGSSSNSHHHLVDTR